MLASTLLTLLSACGPMPAASPVDLAPPPAPGLIVSGPTAAARGATITLHVTLPAAAPERTHTWMVQGDGGPAPICLPPTLGGECLSVSGTRTVYGPELSLADAASFAVTLPVTGAAADFQAVVPVVRRGYYSAPFSVELFDACPGINPNVALPDADGDGVSEDCDLCEGDDAFGDADGDGVCDPYAPLRGLWRGTAGPTHKVVLTFEDDGAGGTVGMVYHPSLGCAGTLDPVSHGVDTWTFMEDAACGGQEITLSIDPTRMELTWAYGGGVAVAWRTSVREVLDGQWRAIVDQPRFGSYDTILDLEATGAAGTSWYLDIPCPGTLTDLGESGLTWTLAEDALEPACVDGTITLRWDPLTGQVRYEWGGGVAYGDFERQSTFEVIAGSWTGTITEPGFGTWGTTITLNADGEVGTAVGTSAYPSLGCTGDLVRVGEDGFTWDFQEFVDAPTCADGVYVRLMWEPFTDVLSYEARLTDGGAIVAYGPLSRL